MTSIRHQIWQVAANDTAWVNTLPQKEKSLLGRDDGKPDIDDPEPPYYYLQMHEDTLSFDGDPNHRESGFRWIGYDTPKQGYSRIRAGLSHLLRLYPEEDASGEVCRDIYVDTDSGEVVYWQTPVGIGPELTDINPEMNQQWADVQTKKTGRGRWP